MDKQQMDLKDKQIETALISELLNHAKKHKSNYQNIYVAYGIYKRWISEIVGWDNQTGSNQKYEQGVLQLADVLEL
jgi:hypothetical protein